jgi:tRNA pseudouridine55 synthase
MMLEGILPIWKESDYTSFDVVAKTRKILSIKKIGHAGTLDPQVTGVLPLCIGRATRLVEYLQERPKEYLAEMIIGISTDTQDMSGTVLQKVSKVNIPQHEIVNIIASFQGEILQIPPMFSAIKVKGKRLYEIARAGLEIERNPRRVNIFQIKVLQINNIDPFIEITFQVICSKGTYIRTLCEDIGKKLGYPAVMKSLIRTASGNIHREQCLTLQELSQCMDQRQLQHRLLPLDFAVDHFQKIFLNQNQVTHLIHGKKIPIDSVEIDINSSAEHHLYRVYSSDQQFIGIVEKQLLNMELRPVKLFLASH